MNNIEEYLKNNSNWCLSGISTTTLTNYLTASIMDFLQRAYHQNRRRELIDFFIQNNICEVDSYLVYYALELYFYMFGQAQYKVSKKGFQLIANGVWSWISKGEFIQGCAEPIYKEYRKANKKINLFMLALIDDLAKSKVITQNKALDLDCHFLYPTHVLYENMKFTDGTFKGKSIIDVLKKYSAKEIQNAYADKFMNCEGWQEPCNSDIYRLFMRYLEQGKLPIGEDCFYDENDDFPSENDNDKKEYPSYDNPSDFNVYTDLPWTP